MCRKQNSSFFLSQLKLTIHLGEVLLLLNGQPAELADHRDVIFYGFDIIYMDRRMGTSASGLPVVDLVP